MKRLLYLLAAAVMAMLTLVPSAFAATQGTVPAPAGTQTQPLPLPVIRLSRSLPPVVRALAAGHYLARCCSAAFGLRDPSVRCL